MDSTVSRRVSSFLARLCHWLVNFPPLHQVTQAASLSSVPSLSQFSYSTSFYCCLLPKRTSLSMFILIDLIYFSTICHHFFFTGSFITPSFGAYHPPFGHPFRVGAADDVTSATTKPSNQLVSTWIQNQT